MPTSKHLTDSLVRYLKEQGLYEQLPEIAADLQAEVERNKNITVVTAVEISSGEQATITKLLNNKWGDHAVLFAIDPILLSGMIITFQDQVIDTSGRNQLQQLSQTLK